MMRELMAPMRYPLDAPDFTTVRGQTYVLKGTPQWTKPLGRRLAIVDIDTRPLDRSQQALNPERFVYGQHGYTSTGMLNHWLYATIHGYDYHLIRTPNFSDRVAPWTKIPALSDHLHNYDMVISIDADALFTHLNLPFEWLLNRWQVPPGASLTMARDPIADQNFDTKGRVYNNAGFIIAQNNPRTHEILRAWASCPEDHERFPGCDNLRQNWPAEQAAFGEYIRYAYDRPTDLHEITCTEGNGWLGSNSGCDGVFVEHMWSGKNEVHRVVGETVAQAVLARAHQDFVDRAAEMVLVRDTNAFMDMDLAGRPSG
ncbi:hypothetical protein P152DRAFT_5547 [Eremomyces bilateralis CBS 781.70]|uniref:Nucleotide-diphospho-sugar transferase domain-containing protein n=1 Tax=Eremomyces bilateralis CBS 781.70 TaxID=1392243 RepID=A0A6G1GG31_9PEZI|nr:uncharacterized protein P152DRAFT_5547 [Eremomyces bilateralis CBS 781.70]KAF1816984.1 hypothetical protein P152DRAFT_5547 [Eremomyces bilateralis CBS 781.70]